MFRFSLIVLHCICSLLFRPFPYSSFRSPRSLVLCFVSHFFTSLYDISLPQFWASHLLVSTLMFSLMFVTTTIALISSVLIFSILPIPIIHLNIPYMNPGHIPPTSNNVNGGTFFILMTYKKDTQKYIAVRV